ncbi:MAG: hypothetical protein JNJ57_17320 [Saprospiraceae bacterium]|nr:hypothetical protein [Saprospiraceae bacterium]
MPYQPGNKAIIKLIIPLFLIGFIFAGCDKAEREFYDGMGKKPVYASAEELRDIKNEAPQPIIQSGTIYLSDTLLFILERHKGIHVFNIADSLNTVNLTFLKIPAISDFTISGTVLYADSWKDLVVIDISKLFQITEAGRVTNVISPPLFPPDYEGAFECVDESKGGVVGWDEVYLESAKCRTF